MKTLMKTMKYFVLVAILSIALAPNTAQAQATGVELWVQNCGNCHTAQPGNRYPSDMWDSIIVHMKIQARLSDADAEAIIAFLKSNAKSRAAVETEVPPLASHAPEMIGETGSGPVPDERIDLSKKPEEIFKSLCVACHGGKGKGNGPAAVAFNPKPANFTDSKFQSERTDEELLDALTDGKGAMPPFKTQLTPEEITSLIAYIRTFSR